MNEFWPELLTKASWQKLQALKTELGDFVVIGGWAIYLWTGMHKSKDIDIIVDFKTLEKLKEAYELGKNARLRKYEIKLNEFDIDVYVSHFSEFVVPVGDLIKKTVSIQGFKTPEPELLLVLKQSAEMDRRGSIKGEKDAIDILTLLLKAPFDKSKYLETLRTYNLSFYVDELVRVITSFDAKNAGHIGLSFNEFQRWRKKMPRELKA